MTHSLISANLPLDNTYVFKEEAKKVFEEVTPTSFFHDNFEALMKPQEEIIDEDEDVEQIVLTNLKVSSPSNQKTQMKGRSDLGPTSMTNLRNAARDELKKQEQNKKGLSQQPIVAQQPALEVGGKLDEEDESGANVGVCIRFLGKITPKKFQFWATPNIFLGGKLAMGSLNDGRSNQQV